MLETAASFLAKMDSIGWKYRDTHVLENGNINIDTSFNGKQTTINFSIFFDTDGYSATVRAVRLFPAPIDKKLQLLEDINNCNKQYRWVKYYIDDEGDVNLQIDALINEETSGEIIVELIRKAVSIIDETYPTFMRTIWA